MANPHRGEVEIVIDGQPHIARLTLGAIAELEAASGAGSMVELVERFEAGRISGRDVMALVVAGLRGGGWTGTAADLIAADIAGGPLGAARVAAALIARAFAAPEPGDG